MNSLQQSSAIVKQQSYTELLSTLKNDKVVGIQNGKKLYLSEILHLVFDERIGITPKRYSSYEKGPVRPGWIHLGKDKNDLRNQTGTTWVRTISTILQYVQNGYEYMTYGTFNLSKNRNYWEKRRSALNSVHAFVIDIDDSNVNLNDIVLFCDEIGMEPTFINATPRGYHVWFSFIPEFVAVGPHQTKDGKETNVGKFYNDLNKWLVSIFKERFNSNEGSKEKGTDHVFGGERYIRIPQNIVHCTKTRYRLNDFVALRKEYYLKHKKPQNTNNRANLRLSYARSSSLKSLLKNDPALNALMVNSPAVGQRRDWVFTIGLMFFDRGFSMEECITELAKWYSTVLKDKNDFQFEEVEREVRSAYAGKFHLAPKKVFEFTGMYPKFYSRKLSEAERKNSTLEKSCNEFLIILHNFGGIWETTTRNAMMELGEKSKNNFDRIVENLIRKGRITKEVVGKGRFAKTIFRLKTKPQDPNKKSNKVIIFPCSSQKLGSNFNAPKPYTLFKSLLGGREGTITNPDSVKIRGKPV
ncbi:hypothetical protein NSQ59_27345 [Margalitia sp. FSL K6-0131]|uniref:hypothetical protein n=1 Tax=Margalitia sp. FSL K6-0131 TaxID=2954604 RepID=UPI0030F95EF1